MKHKRSGMPSKSFLVAYLRKYVDQRFTIQLAVQKRKPDDSHLPLLKQANRSWWEYLTDPKKNVFEEELPVFFDAIYSHCMKHPKLVLYFRDVMFYQGTQFMLHPFAQARRQNKRQMIGFELSEIMGFQQAEWLRGLAPRLGNNSGRLNYSEEF